MLKKWSLLAIGAAFTLQSPAFASDVDKSRLPAMAIYQTMLDANKPTGWVQFRNFNGAQLIYFTALQTLHCRLSEIRYSVNSTKLDKRFELVKCNPQLPFSLPDGAGLKEIAISLPLKTADTIAVQIVWDEGKEPEIVVYEPCQNVGEQSCAQLIE